jgi:tRNA(fMet)-specific endonuclease VapC
MLSRTPTDGSVYSLDTTTMIHLYNRHLRVEANYLLHANLASGHSVGVASINVEEITSGWLNYLKQARTVQEEVNGSRYLNDAIRHLSQFTLYEVTAAAITRHTVLRGMKLNVGRNDLRLAALALELGAIVVTDNIRDFGRVSGFTWVDWTK